MTDAAIPRLLLGSGPGIGDLPRAAARRKGQGASGPTAMARATADGGIGIGSGRSFSALVAGPGGRVRDGAVPGTQPRGPGSGKAADRPDAANRGTADGQDREPVMALLPMLVQPQPPSPEPLVLPAGQPRRELAWTTRAGLAGFDDRIGPGMGSTAQDAVAQARDAEPVAPAGQAKAGPEGADAMAAPPALAVDVAGEGLAARVGVVMPPGGKADQTMAAAGSLMPGSGRPASGRQQAETGVAAGPTLSGMALHLAEQAGRAPAMMAAGPGADAAPSALTIRSRGAAPGSAATLRMTADAGGGAAANVPFSFQTGSGVGGGSGGGATTDFRAAAMPAAAWDSASETVGSQSFADVVIGMREGAGLEVELAAADATAAERLRDELGQLERDLAENGSDVEAIRVELRGGPVADEQERPRPAMGGSGPERENPGGDDGADSGSRHERGGSSDAMEGQGMAEWNGSRDGRPMRGPADTGAGNGVAGEVRPGMAGAGRSGAGADGKVDRYG